jgi:hypothetical protein
LLPEDGDSYATCMRDEHAAEADLKRQWASFSPDHRRTCVEETGVGGSPSYVEVLTCMQMYADKPSATGSLRVR